MSEIIDFRNLSFIARAPKIEEGSLHETFEELRSVHTPESLENQVITVGEETPESNLLLFTDFLPRSDDPEPMQRGKQNLIVFDVEDDTLEMTGDLDPSLIDSFTQTFSEVLGIVEKLHVIDYRLDFIIDVAFDELSVSVSGPEEFDFQGVRFIHDNFNYIIQSHFAHRIEERDVRDDPTIDEGDRDKESTRARLRQIEHTDVDEPEAFIHSNVDQATATLSRLLP